MPIDTAVKKRTFFTGRHGLSMVEEFYDLFVNQTTAADGVWFDASGWETVTVSCIINSSTATFKIGGTNGNATPANSGDGVDLATALTANGYFKLQRHELPRWVKPHPDTVGADVSIYMKVTRFVGQDVTT